MTIKDTSMFLDNGKEIKISKIVNLAMSELGYVDLIRDFAEKLVKGDRVLLGYEDDSKKIGLFILSELNFALFGSFLYVRGARDVELAKKAYKEAVGLLEAPYIALEMLRDGVTAESLISEDFKKVYDDVGRLVEIRCHGGNMILDRLGVIYTLTEGDLSCTIRVNCGAAWSLAYYFTQKYEYRG